MLLSWLLGTSLIKSFSGQKMEESVLEEEHLHLLTEPIMDASYLDDEINTVNDEFSSWKLINDNNTTGYVRRPRSLLTNLNNNNSFDNSQQNYYSDSQHGETIASITGSILEQLDIFDEESIHFSDDHASSLTTTTSTDSSLTNRKLFPTPQQTTSILSTFSTDSLDKSTLLSKLNAINIDNYTIAFNSSSTMLEKSSKLLYNSSSQKKYELPDLKFLLEKTPLVLAKNTKIKKINQKIDLSKVRDVESLKVLLPWELVQELDEKPEDQREKEDASEKERDESAISSSHSSGANAASVANAGNAGNAETAANAGVVFRKNKRQLDPHKRFSGVDKKSGNKFKRFSLQEIEEITEITKNIDATLKTFDEQQTRHYSRLQGNGLSDSVIEAVNELHRINENKTIYSRSSHGKLVLEKLCPAIYSLLSDGLTPFIETIFGRVHNTVWRVVEASIHSGPSAQTLSELVLRINSEELMAEGPVKFNAFIVGLLNLRCLSSWLSFLRTKDRLLRSHFAPSGFIYNINTSTRLAFDELLSATNSLAKHPYNLDIFHEIKELHSNLNSKQKNMKHFENHRRSQMKRSFSDERPKKKKVTKTIPKSKTQNNILAEEEGNKFKKLQLQWEMMSGNENNKKSPTACLGSKIPRPIFNVRPSSAFQRK